jgi:hypothetical protein
MHREVVFFCCWCSSLQSFCIWVSLWLKKVGKFTLNLSFFLFLNFWHQSDENPRILFFYFVSSNVFSCFLYSSWRMCCGFCFSWKDGFFLFFCVIIRYPFHGFARLFNQIVLDGDQIIRFWLSWSHCWFLSFWWILC